MIIIPSAEATVLGDLRTHLPENSVTVMPEDYEPPAAGLQTIGAAYAPTPEGREALRVAAALARASSARCGRSRCSIPSMPRSSRRGCWPRSTTIGTRRRE